MIKFPTLLITFFVATLGHAQLIEGEIINDGRKILGEPKYIIEGMKDGWAKYELSVDINGAVTGVQLLESNSLQQLDTKHKQDVSSNY